MRYEYGHTFDSHLFGPLYLPIVGLSSALNLKGYIGGNPDTFWTEKRAENWASWYLRRMRW